MSAHIGTQFSMSRRALLGGALAAGLTAAAPDLGGFGAASAALAPVPKQGLLFDAACATSQFSRYISVFPSGVTEGVDFGVVPDPTGLGRKVAYFDNRRGLKQGATAPRAEAESPCLIKPLANGNTIDEYWVGTSVYLPADFAPLAAGSWLHVLSPAYGPPWGGTSPLGIGLRPISRERVQVVMGGDPRLLGAGFTMPTDTWCNVVMQFKFGYQGWVRMWTSVGVGGAPNRIPIRGKDTYSMATMAPGVNDAWYKNPAAGANSTRVSAYGAPARVYFGHHKLAVGAGSVAMVS